MSAVFKNGNNGVRFNFTSVLLVLGFTGFTQLMRILNCFFIFVTKKHGMSSICITCSFVPLFFLLFCSFGNNTTIL